MMRLRRLMLLLPLALCLLSGCAVRLIMEYDDQLDKGLTTLQQSTEQFLSQLDSEAGSPKAADSANKDFYIHAEASLRTLETRAQSEPKSKIVYMQMEELRKSYEDLKGLHQLDGDKGMSPGEIHSARSGIESQFVSLFTLQLALKNRIKSPSTTQTAPALAK